MREEPNRNNRDRYEVKYMCLREYSEEEIKKATEMTGMMEEEFYKAAKEGSICK